MDESLFLMPLSDFKYSEIEGGYRIGTISPSDLCESMPYGFNQDSNNFYPITPSKYRGKYILEIGKCAFKSSNIIKITISAPVKIIHGYSFENCANLVEVVLPSTVSSILECAFCLDSKISLITFCRNEAITVGSDLFLGSNSSVIINVPKTSSIDKLSAVTTKKVLNPNCLFPRKIIYTCKRRNMFLSTFTPILYQIIACK